MTERAAKQTLLSNGQPNICERTGSEGTSQATGGGHWRRLLRTQGDDPPADASRCCDRLRQRHKMSDIARA
jgi:serine/threonine protein kinase HipA of HipAB toxin-antitoxin module